MSTGFLQFARSSLRYSLDLVLPPVCVSCAIPVTEHNLLCAQCWRGLERIVPPICERLGTPLPGVTGPGPHFSFESESSCRSYDRTRSAAHYSGVMSKLVVRFKFEDKHEPLPLFLRLLEGAGRDLFATADVLIPVPLHRLRLLQRRYNQSALLTKGLSKMTGIPCDQLALKRIKRTKAQTALSREERGQNVANAFAVAEKRKGAVAGKNIVLIDDVITTGSTVNACAGALKAAGATSVSVLSIAIALPGRRDLDMVDAVQR